MFTQLNKAFDFILYISISIVTAFCSLSMTYWWGKEGTFLFQNSSPFIIISTVYFFLFFTKVSLSCRFVNWVSASCFAAYIIHCSPFVFYPFYVNVIKSWYVSETDTLFLLYTIGIIFCFFIFSILLDKVRIVVWNVLYRACSL